MDKSDLFREAMQVFVRVQAAKRLSTASGAFLMLDAGHFALETHAAAIAAHIRGFQAARG